MAAICTEWTDVSSVLGVHRFIHNGNFMGKTIFVFQTLEVPTNSETTIAVEASRESTTKTMVVDATTANAAVLGHARDLGNHIANQPKRTLPTSR